MGSRRIPGFALGQHHDAQLAYGALAMAVAVRGGEVPGVIMHTDRGSEGGFNWSSQHLDGGGVAMGVGARQRAVRLYRGQMPSPGRPTVAWREDRVRFWAAIARGVSSEEAAAGIGVSQAVGTRWFRQAGGDETEPFRGPCRAGTCRFAEREEIAIWRAQDAGVREIARRLGRSPSTISRELRRNASTRTYRLDYRASTAQWHADRRARRPKVARLAAERAALRVCAGPARRHDHQARRRSCAGPRRAVDRTAPRAPGRPALGRVVEPGADREPAPDRLPR